MVTGRSRRWIRITNPVTNLVIEITESIENSVQRIVYIDTQIKELEVNSSVLPDIVLASLKKQKDIEMIDFAQKIIFK